MTCKRLLPARRPSIARSHAIALSTTAVAIMLATTVFETSPAIAQQGSPGYPPGGYPTSGPGGTAPAKPAAAPKPAAKAKPETAPAASSNDAGLRQRIEGLEEQLVDIQVQLGTLETLAKSSGAASASPAYRASSPDSGGSPVDTGRIAGLENQVRTLTQQVQQLTDQVRTLGGNPGRPIRDGNLAPGGAPLPPMSDPASTTTVATARPGSTPPGWTASPQAPPRDGALAGPADIAGSTLPPIPAATGPSGGNDPGAKSAYESAYQNLLQQDYGAAEVAFDDFVKRYPNDSLAGNAQFWLGETHFVRGQFKPAASAFLKGYRTYGRGSKAPDSLLKLAMSLGRLGQKDEACSALGELAAKYPAATNDVKSRAAAERQRNGCP